MRDLVGKRVAMVVAHEGFRDEELFLPRTLLERRGAEVIVLSDRSGEAAGKLGGSVHVDGSIAAARAEDFSAVVFVGGPGVRAYANRPDCHNLARGAAAAGRVVAAICAAGAILANAGLLKGRRATCYPTEAETLRRAGALYAARALEVDGNLITADGPQSASLFGATLADALASRPGASRQTTRAHGRPPNA
jgi:protease I